MKHLGKVADYKICLRASFYHFDRRLAKQQTEWIRHDHHPPLFNAVTQSTVEITVACLLSLFTAIIYSKYIIIFPPPKFFYCSFTVQNNFTVLLLFCQCACKLKKPSKSASKKGQKRDAFAPPQNCRANNHPKWIISSYTEPVQGRSRLRRMCLSE